MSTNSRFNIVGVGDAFVPVDAIVQGCQSLIQMGGQFIGLEWEANDRAAMHAKERKIEVNGPDAEALPKSMLDAVSKAHVLIVHFCPVSAKTITVASQLRMLGVCRAGCENIDVETASRKGVVVFHVMGRNANAVAEFTIGLMITETRNIARSHAALKVGVWRKDFLNAETCPELSGKVVGIVGFGAIGRVVAQKLCCFETTVLAYDPYVSAKDMVACGVEPTGLDDLLSRSDVVTIHVRLTPETKGLIGTREIRLMKPSAYIVNTSRPAVIDEEALLRALRERRIAGAALDVLGGDEGPTRNPLVGLDNVTVTSQLAGSTVEAFTRSPRILVEDMVMFLRSGKARFLVNPKVAARVDHVRLLESK